jgi:hypothetical protein
MVAYIFKKTRSAWSTTPAATLSDPAETVDDYSGIAVAVSGTTAAVGQPIRMAQIGLTSTGRGHGRTGLRPIENPGNFGPVHEQI